MAKMLLFRKSYNFLGNYSNYEKLANARDVLYILCQDRSLGIDHRDQVFATEVIIYQPITLTPWCSPCPDNSEYLY